ASLLCLTIKCRFMRIQCLLKLRQKVLVYFFLDLIKIILTQSKRSTEQPLFKPVNAMLLRPLFRLFIRYVKSTGSLFMSPHSEGFSLHECRISVQRIFAGLGNGIYDFKNIVSVNFHSF